MSQKDGKIDDETNLLELINIIIKNYLFIISLTLIVTVLAIFYAKSLPDIYQSTAKILPPGKESSSLGSLASQLPGGMMSLASGALGMKDSGDLYIGLLKSRTISDKIIEKYNLMEIYKTKLRKDTRAKLEHSVFFELDKKSGILSISYEDVSPERAADITNEYVYLLKDLNNKINLTSAEKERIFLEKRLKMSSADLKMAQENFMKFQEKNKAIDVSVQGKAVIEAGASIQGYVLAAEVELKSLQTILSPDNSRIRALKEKIKELKKQLKDIEGKDPVFSSNSESNNDKFYTPMSGIPAMSVKYANLIREVKIQEALFEVLTKQYELARINEAKESSNIQVLDYAQVSEKGDKVKPNRREFIMIAGIFSLIFSVLLVFLKEFIYKFKQNNPR